MKVTHIVRTFFGLRVSACKDGALVGSLFICHNIIKILKSFLHTSCSTTSEAVKNKPVSQNYQKIACFRTNHRNIQAQGTYFRLS